MQIILVVYLSTPSRWAPDEMCAQGLRQKIAEGLSNVQNASQRLVKDKDTNQHQVRWTPIPYSTWLDRSDESSP